MKIDSIQWSNCNANFVGSIILSKIILLALLFSTIVLRAQTEKLQSGVYQLNTIDTQNGLDVKKKIKVLGNTTDLAMLSMHSSTLAPGKTNHPPRALMDREELIIVKEGPLTIIINDTVKIVSTGSIALIEAGDIQNFHNASDKVVSYYVLGFQSTNPVDISRGKENGGSVMKDWDELVIKKTNKGESRSVFDKPTSMFKRLEAHSTMLNPGEDSHPSHSHQAEEIMLLLKGYITMHIDNKNYVASAGSVILVRPNIPHNLSNTGNEPCLYYAIKWYNSNTN
ncbi:cupin domain-containing protein [Flavobacterium cellulosilyticum]|uniref:Cupin domain-containing protein n=1 Tax=Flavobacterium cellulosilyticum TaxID=2541731 RepID=A0A4R5CBS0_9FLAO|nr:cupin domain-containing protein [Flavobacterium cellulosilyticum]TDD95700.1 cupin domain-containing protein [Flavobacterium cellulosilyticum]